MIQVSNLQITSIAEMNESNLLVIGSSNNKVYLLNTTLGKATSSFEAHEDSVVALFYSQSRGILITNSADSTYKTWNVAKSTKLPLHIYYDTENSIVSADYREEDNLHICVDQDGNLILRVLNKGNELNKLFLENANEDTFVKFDQSNNNQFFVGTEEKLDVYDARMNKIIVSYPKWNSVKGLANDSEKAMIFMKYKPLSLSKFDEGDKVVKEWDNFGELTHLKMRTEKNNNNGIIILGNENGDVYYSKI